MQETNVDSRKSVTAPKATGVPNVSDAGLDSIVAGLPHAQPFDEHNRALIANVHPTEWTNPQPSGRYNIVVVGGGTAGLVTAAGAAGLGAKVALSARIESRRRFSRWLFRMWFPRFRALLRCAPRRNRVAVMISRAE